jgi:hypothetical protein
MTVAAAFEVRKQRTESSEQKAESREQYSLILSF